MHRQKRVFWSRGMLLTEQHFQAQDQFVEDEQRFRALLSRFANWGVAEIEIDETTLSSSAFKLNKCVGVLPDGVLFSIPSTDAAPPSREFQDLFPPDRPTLDVFLALAEQKTGGKNISYDASAMSRYVAHDQDFADQRDGREERIEVIYHNFSIVFGSETPPSSTRIRIAQIARKQGGGFQLNEQFVPPCINSSCSKYLCETLLRGLLIELSFIWKNLSAERGEQSERLADFTGLDYKRLWVLHIVNRAAPELTHLLSTPNVHPEKLYVFLLRLAGALCTFSTSTELSPFAFPKYNHNDLGGSFNKMVELTKRLFTTIIYRPRRCIPIPLEEASGESWSGWRAQIADSKYFDGRLFLVLRAVDPQKELDPQMVEAYVKICGPATVDDVSMHALEALPLRHTPTAPSECPRRYNSMFFRIYPQPGNDVWEDIRDHGIRIIVLPGIAESSYELFTVLPD